MANSFEIISFLIPEQPLPPIVRLTDRVLLSAGLDRLQTYELETQPDMQSADVVTQALLAHYKTDLAYLEYELRGRVGRIISVSFRGEVESKSVQAVALGVPQRIVYDEESEQLSDRLVQVATDLHQRAGAMRTILHQPMDPVRFWEEERERLETGKLLGHYWLDLIDISLLSESYLEEIEAQVPYGSVIERHPWGLFVRQSKVPY